MFSITTDMVPANLALITPNPVLAVPIIYRVLSRIRVDLVANFAELFFIEVPEARVTDIILFTVREQHL